MTPEEIRAMLRVVSEELGNWSNQLWEALRCGPFDETLLDEAQTIEQAAHLADQAHGCLANWEIQRKTL